MHFILKTYLGLMRSFNFSSESFAAGEVLLQGFPCPGKGVGREQKVAELALSVEETASHVAKIFQGLSNKKGAFSFVRRALEANSSKIAHDRTVFEVCYYIKSHTDDVVFSMAADSEDLRLVPARLCHSSSIRIQ